MSRFRLISLFPDIPLPFASLLRPIPRSRRCWSWPRIIDQPQVLREQAPRHRDFGHLERDVPSVTGYLRAAAAIGKSMVTHVDQSESVIAFPIGEKTGIRGDLATVEPRLQAAARNRPLRSLDPSHPMG